MDLKHGDTNDRVRKALQPTLELKVIPNVLVLLLPSNFIFIRGLQNIPLDTRKCQASQKLH